jgi:hypothetical protein
MVGVAVGVRGNKKIFYWMPCLYGKGGDKIAIVAIAIATGPLVSLDIVEDTWYSPTHTPPFDRPSCLAGRDKKSFKNTNW